VYTSCLSAAKIAKPVLVTRGMTRPSTPESLICNAMLPTSVVPNGSDVFS